jgi:AcrR family transcriptional regulator
MTKREQILQAATAVFLESGYEGTSMERVAAASGAARRTLYNQFHSKEALFEAITMRVWASFPVFDITRDETALRDPRAGLTRLARAVADFWEPAEAVAFLRMVVIEGERFPGLIKTFFDSGKTPATNAVTKYLESLTSRGLISVPHAALAARQFVGAINEPLLWLRLLGCEQRYSGVEREAIITNAVGMFLAWYEPKQTA